MGLILTLVLLLGSLFIVRVYTQDTSEKQLVCNYPTIKYGDDCCIDMDRNMICDSMQLTKHEIDTYDYEKEINDLKRKIIALENDKIALNSDVQRYKNLYENYKYDYFKWYNDYDEDIDITIAVYDDYDQDPIEDARVRIENDKSETEYTDDDGEVEFRNLDEDCYDIRISASDYETLKRTRCLDEDDDGHKFVFYLDRD